MGLRRVSRRASQGSRWAGSLLCGGRFMFDEANNVWHWMPGVRATPGVLSGALADVVGGLCAANAVCWVRGCNSVGVGLLWAGSLSSFWWSYARMRAGALAAYAPINDGFSCAL